MEIDIRETDLKTICEITTRIPEFNSPHGYHEYESRLRGRKCLLLGAFHQDQCIGFKVGYDRHSNGSFYSWMGGVLPPFRKHSVAKRLAAFQEAWAMRNGYDRIIFKTRNRHKAMLIFALSNGFHITDVQRDGYTIDEYRIILQKKLC